MLKSDVFIIYPAHYENALKFPENPEDATSNFTKMMHETTNYELVNRFCKHIERYKVADVTFQIRSDDLTNPKTLGTVKAECMLSVIKSISLVNVTFRIDAYQENATVLLDQISREDLQVIIENKTLSLSEYLSKTYNIIKNGEAKITMTQNERASLQDRMYYLAAESNCSEAINAQITSRKLKRQAQQNLAVYDFSEIYMSENVIYQVYQNYDKDEDEKLYYESLLVFIVELLVFQISAINRTNLEVEKVLKTQKDVSIKKVNVLLSQFAKTMGLWENKLFRYPNTQNIYDNMRSRFQLANIRDNFRHNHQHLNDIVHVRNVHNSLIESKILFAIAIALFSKEIFNLSVNIYQRGIADVLLKPLGIFSSISVLIIILLYLLYNRIIKSRA